MSRARPQMGTQGDVIPARIGAFLIDTILIGIVTFVIALVLSLIGFGSGSDVLGAIVGLVLIPIVLVIQFGYFIYFEAESGQTPGKRLLNLVVVTETGEGLSYRDSAIRNLLRIVDGLGIVIPYLVALVLILLTDENQRLGDIVADTVVVRAE